MAPLRKSLLLAAVLAFSLAWACGSDNEAAPTATATATATPTPTPTPTPVPTPTPPPTKTPAVPVPAGIDGGTDPDLLLRQSAEAMALVDSFHFEVSGRIDLSSGDGSAALPISFVGDAQAPDRSRGKLTISMLVFVLDMEIVTVDGVTYTMNTQSSQWEVSAAGNQGVPNPAAFIGGGDALMAGAAYVGSEVRDGEQVHHLAGTVHLDALAGLEGQTAADIWIGTEDLLLREVAVEAPVDLEALGLPVTAIGLEGSGVATLSIQLSGYGDPVNIEAPIVP